MLCYELRPASVLISNLTFFLTSSKQQLEGNTLQPGFVTTWMCIYVKRPTTSELPDNGQQSSICREIAAISKFIPIIRKWTLTVHIVFVNSLNCYSESGWDPNPVAPFSWRCGFRMVLSSWSDRSWSLWTIRPAWRAIVAYLEVCRLRNQTENCEAIACLTVVLEKGEIDGIRHIHP